MPSNPGRYSSSTFAMIQFLSCSARTSASGVRPLAGPYGWYGRTRPYFLGGTDVLPSHGWYGRLARSLATPRIQRTAYCRGKLGRNVGLAVPTERTPPALLPCATAVSAVRSAASHGCVSSVSAPDRAAHRPAGPGHGALTTTEWVLVPTTREQSTSPIGFRYHPVLRGTHQNHRRRQCPSSSPSSPHPRSPS